MEIRTQSPQRQTHRDTVQAPAPGRPQERYVRDALRRLEHHRFALPVVTPSSASVPKRSGDW